jgi:hypothetical protein
MNKSELAAVIKKLVKEHKRSSAKKGLTEGTFGDDAPHTLTFTYEGFEVTEEHERYEYGADVGGLVTYKCTDIEGLTLYVSLGANAERSMGEIVDVNGVGDYPDGASLTLSYGDGKNYHCEIK